MFEAHGDAKDGEVERHPLHVTVFYARSVRTYLWIPSKLHDDIPSL